MSNYASGSLDPVSDFFDWRYHARENYESVTIYVLPSPTISINFCKDTTSAEDSYVFGIILGNKNKEQKSEISLYNSIFPNRNSLSFNKSHPNTRWGEVFHVYSFDINGSLIAADVNSRNDIICAYDNSLMYIGESEKYTNHFDDDEQITLIKCSPDENSNSAFICSSKNKVMYYEKPDQMPISIHEFNRPVIDLSIDPFQTKTALAAQGKTHIHLIDQRDSNATSLKMQNLTGSVAFNPHIPFIFANGLLSGEIGFYDLRSPTIPLCSIQAHDSEIISLKWAPFRKDVIASASLDAAITLWSMTSAKKSNSDAIFVHNGHVSPITAFDWCKDIPWTIASVSEDNLFEIWTVAPSQYES